MSRGGSSTSTTQLDPALRDAALRNLAIAQKVGQLGVVPYKGATVAGLQPAQIAAMQNMNAGLSAFGLEGSPIPAAGDLSPYAIYQAQLANMDPGQRNFIQSMFIDPITGAAPTADFMQNPQQQSGFSVANLIGGLRTGDDSSSGGASSGSANRSMTSLNTPLSYAPGGTNTRNPNSIINRVADALSPRPSGTVVSTSKIPAAKSTSTASRVQTSRDKVTGKRS